MSLERVQAALAGTELEDAIIRLDHTGATVALAADAIGCDPDQIAKTLSFLVNDEPVLIVAAGTTRIDNKKFKAYFHTKVRMIPATDVEALTGHPAGGVCPFGVLPGVKIYLDASLSKYELYYPAAGDENYVIRMPIAVLRRLVNIADTIDVTQELVQ